MWSRKIRKLYHRQIYLQILFCLKIYILYLSNPIIPSDSKRTILIVKFFIQCTILTRLEEEVSDSSVLTIAVGRGGCLKDKTIVIEYNNNNWNVKSNEKYR